MKKRIFYFIGYVCGIILILLSGCKAIQQKKTDRAVSRVLYDSAAFNYVGKVWERFNPCVNDTIIDIDTLSVPIFMDAEIDVDSLRAIICDSSRPQPPRIIRVPVECPPSSTQIRYVRDTRHEMIIRDSVEYWKRRAIEAESRIAGVTANNQVLTDQIVQCKSETDRAVTKRTLLMLIPIVLLLIIGYLITKKR